MYVLIISQLSRDVQITYSIHGNFLFQEQLC